MTTQIDEDAAAVARRGELEATLVDYVTARDSQKLWADRVKDLGGDLKQWLEEHPEELLVDGERGIVAQLQERSLPGRACDFNAMYDNDARLLEQLVRNGCLKVDEDAIKRAGPLVAGIDRYLAPKGKTFALEVKQHGK